MSKLDTSKIKQCRLKDSEFFQEAVSKKQIYVHHTAGNSSGVNVASDWNNDKRGRIATAFVISGKGAKNSVDGEIIQCFSSAGLAYHLGVKQGVFRALKLPWKNLDAISIGIEVCNWGGLTLENGKFMNYVDREVPKDQVTELDEPFKGYKYYHKYSDAQIESVRQLLVYLGETYKIDLSFDYDQLFKVNVKALRGDNGLYTHNSVRKDKNDIYPCPRMIKMFKTLK
jgi:N-acetyl-anhydromuramyl-L-alanine amidase AmpD